MKIDGAAYVTVASQIAYAMASLWYLSEKIRINAIRIEKTLFSGIIWSRFFYDADAGDDTGTANCTL